MMLITKNSKPISPEQKAETPELLVVHRKEKEKAKREVVPKVETTNVLPIESPKAPISRGRDSENHKKEHEGSLNVGDGPEARHTPRWDALTTIANGDMTRNSPVSIGVSNALTPSKEANVHMKQKAATVGGFYQTT